MKNKLIRLLKIFQTDYVQHAGQTYVDHCSGVYDGLESWGFQEEVCSAGFLHSIYGTERFFSTVPTENRSVVQDLVGKNAEGLAFLNCAMIRAEFDNIILRNGDRSIRNRFTLNGKIVFSDDATFRNIFAIQLADWLDQVPFCREWSYRRAVYERIAHELGGPALATFRWVYRGGR